MNGDYAQFQNESIQWIHSLAYVIITDENHMSIFQRFIEYIPNSFSRLNVTQFNHAIRVHKDRFLIWLRKMMCEHLLTLTGFDKNNYSLKNKNKGHTALMDIFPLIALIADYKSVTKSHLTDYFKIKNEKNSSIYLENEFDNDILEELHTNAEEIKLEMSEVKTEMSVVKSQMSVVKSQMSEICNYQKTLSTRHESLDSTLTRIEALLNKTQRFNPTNLLGSSNNPIPINNNNHFPNLATPSNTQAFAALMRNNSNNQSPRSSKRTRNDQQATTSQITRTNTQPNGQNVINRIPNANTRQQSSSQSALRNFNSFEPGSKNTEIRKENEWTTKTRRFNKSKGYFKSVGTGAVVSDLISTVNKTYPVFIGRLDNTISKENIEKFLNTKFKTPISGLTQITLKHKHFSSYYLYINILEKKLIENKNEWPQGLIVNRYSPPRAQPVTLPITNTTAPSVSAVTTTTQQHSSSDSTNTNANRFENLHDETENLMESTSNESSSANNLINKS